MVAQTFIPQGIANVLWASATSGLPVSDSLLAVNKYIYIYIYTYICIYVYIYIYI